MKIALVTNTELHNKYWTAQLCKEFDVELVIIPKRNNKITRSRLNKVIKYGVPYSILKLMSLLYAVISKNSYKNINIKNEAKYFGDYNDVYSTQVKSKLLEVNTVNDQAVIEEIIARDIDVICFLGGDIARSDFINAPKIATLNYHSGVSPFYNGNKTIFHAVSDFRPNFTGGTLMYINERIDGGNVISHYLVPIEIGDTASDLFMKNIIGSVKLYVDALKQIGNGIMPIGIPQKKSIRYLRNVDWCIEIIYNPYKYSSLLSKIYFT